MRVPWARSAAGDRLRLCLRWAGNVVVAVPAVGVRDHADAEHGRRAPRHGAFRWCDQARAAPAPDGVDAEALAQRGALSRVALMAGAIEKMCQLTVSYTNERVQFGRPVARFQAVQQHLVWAAQDAALVRMAAEMRCPRGHPAATPTVRDRRSQARRQPGGCSGHEGLPPGARRHGHDPGVPTAPLQPPPVELAQGIRLRRPLVGGARQHGHRRRRRRPLPPDHRRHRCSGPDRWATDSSSCDSTSPLWRDASPFASDLENGLSCSRHFANNGGATSPSTEGDRSDAPKHAI